MEEEHAVGELVRQAHVVSDDNAGQLQLKLQLLNEIAEKLREAEGHMVAEAAEAIEEAHATEGIEGGNVRRR